MMKRIKVLIATFAVALFGAFTLVPAAPVGALDPVGDVCSQKENKSAAICAKDEKSATDFIGIIVNTLLFVVGALAVVMIIVAGILYVTSAGDSGKVARAKNTLMYSIVGLVIAFLAYAIINWVVKLF